MDWHALVPLGSAVVGGLVVHLLSRRRDLANKRKEQRVAYLIEAYRRLEECSQQFGISEKRKLESAVADIQLFGTPRQVDLVQRFASDFAAKGNASLDALLADLRVDLRAELDLEAVPKNIVHLRTTNDKGQR